MRTFAHFGTDDQEHRLLHLAGELPEPAETPEAAALPETVDTPVITPEAIDAEAASVVYLANVDIDAAATQLNAVDTTGVTEDPNVQDAGSNLWAEMRAMDEQPDTRVPLDAPVDPLGGEKNIPGIPESFDTKENERAKTPVVNDTNEGFGPGYPEFAKRQGDLPNGGVKADSGNEGFGPGYPEFAKRQGDLPNGGVKADSGNEGFGPGYPEFAKRQGENRASKEAAQAAVASIGETIPMPEQLVAVDGFGDSEVDGIPKEMMDVRSTLEDRVLNRFAKSFPGVLIDTYDMPNEYVINAKDPAVMEKIRQQAEAHGLSPKDNGDGTMTVTITGFEKGVGYTGPGNSPKEATQPSEPTLDDFAARDMENSKRDNPEKPAVEPELTLDDYAARDMENSKRDNPEKPKAEPEMTLDDYAARDIENSKRDNPEKPAVEPELTLDDYAARDMENSKRDNPEKPKAEP
ncbi:MAG: hypothetical protein KBC47_02750, partial [Candidatus Peribacteraceae bacterium]|nr:hypothetical protein [Candidatus Peribacteraceae bacterium]